MSKESLQDPSSGFEPIHSQPCRLSVILPVKNGRRYIDQALLSIQQNIGEQDEVIVIDDESTDNTANIVRCWQQRLETRLPVTLLHGAGLGPAKARNKGLQIARGQYITFLDHDDYWPVSRIDSHLALLDRDSSIDVVIGKTQYVREAVGEEDRDEDTVGCPHLGQAPSRPKESDRSLGFGDVLAIFHVHLGGSTFRRRVFERVGLFDESLRFSEDHDLFLRIREAGMRIEPHDDISLFYRTHANNMTRNIDLSNMQLVHVIRQSLKRRRLGDLAVTPFPKSK